ncbi:MAG: right-handed parallel beta-helix repeat-containing protein [Actinomycetota bacterium]|nr:right-handed parallel beta-helix repeat-containing protein [Actinomycetota bacterium]
MRLAAAGATIDGVTVRNHAQAGIQTATSNSGYTVRNTIMTDTEAGIDLETSTTDPQLTLIERNRFDRNNRPTLRSGIYSDGTADHVSIEDNLFVAHNNVPINISGVGAGRIQRNITIAGNAFEDERHLLLLDADGVEVTGNTFSEGRSRAISVEGGVQDLAISGNTIEDAPNAGIIFLNRYSAGTNGTAMIEGNSITGTTEGDLPVAGGAAVAIAEETSGLPGYTGELNVTGNEITGNAAGIRNSVAGATVNAPNNWWGCSAGPGNAPCDSISGNVTATPNVVLSLDASASRVPVGAPVSVTASVDENSAGQPVDLPVLEGHGISFGASGGSVSPATALVADGSAVTQFTGTTSGPASVTAGLDAETASIGVFVGAAPGVASATLSGSGTVGEALTCSAAGVTGNPEPAVSTAWLRGGNEIAGQTRSAYAPVEDDTGSGISCRITVTNEFGSTTADSAEITVAGRPVPPPPEPKPPVIKPQKKQIRVPNSGKVVVAAVRCPDGTCRINTPNRVKVRIRGKVYRVRVAAPNRVTKGDSARIRIVLPKAARKALRGTRTKAKVRIVLTSSNGERTVTNRAVKLKGAKKRNQR